MKVFLLPILIFFSYVSAFACDCKTITKADNFQFSKLIFTGKVIESEENYFEVEPIEVLKGNVGTKLLFSIDGCSIFPNQNEVWLIYADSIMPDSLYASQCGWSRKLDTESPSIPPPRMGNPEFYYDWVIKDLYRKNLQGELESDINSMRYFRSLSTINKLEEKLIDIEEKLKETNNASLIYIIIGLSVVIVLLLVRILLKK